MENTRLITEFMGWESFKHDHLPNKVYRGELGKHLDNFNYHSDWNELMSVVKDIQQLEIEEFSKKKPIMDALLDVDIEILYNAVIVFLQWHRTTLTTQINNYGQEI